jgi:hypothetical protein
VRELPIKDEEGQPAEVITVQVGQEHRPDFSGIEPASLQRGQRRGPAVEEDWHRWTWRADVNAGLEPAAAAEGVAGPGKGDGQVVGVPRFHGTNLSPDCPLRMYGRPLLKYSFQST